jgi:hypothetical protein
MRQLQSPQQMRDTYFSKLIASTMTHHHTCGIMHLEPRIPHPASRIRK